MHSDLGNASQIFELRSKLKEMKQGFNLVTQYFSDLQDLWNELDQSEAKSRRSAWPSGGPSPFPSPEEAFAKVRWEEDRRKVMLNDDPPLSSALEAAEASDRKKMGFRWRQETSRGDGTTMGSIRQDTYGCG
ncbi:hypothetical protein JRO89_XS15G0042900 [Xanthoceras sorbifolium]|uniref:Uncharacterized protein n=1 Tax=Xanthoceras sorbifolium TaxID=99658 RepID=A0ABQ8H101_9ROSI|nr:hypothetical protein JRO89_XS15G0042900 [Xanthoceras sorbifolium]